MALHTRAAVEYLSKLEEKAQDGICDLCMNDFIKTSPSDRFCSEACEKELEQELDRMYEDPTNFMFRPYEQKASECEELREENETLKATLLVYMHLANGIPLPLH